VIDNAPYGQTDWVVSRYIERPLLLRGARKFDIRTWVLLDQHYHVHMYRCCNVFFFRWCSVSRARQTVLCGPRWREGAPSETSHFPFCLSLLLSIGKVCYALAPWRTRWRT
jgi:hypothetical protein